MLRTRIQELLDTLQVLIMVPTILSKRFVKPLSSIYMFIWRRRFSEYFLYHFHFLFVMEITSYVLSFRMVFFYLVTRGWIFLHQLM